MLIKNGERMNFMVFRNTRASLKSRSPKSNYVTRLRISFASEKEFIRRKSCLSGDLLEIYCLRKKPLFSEMMKTKVLLRNEF